MLGIVSGIGRMLTAELRIPVWAIAGAFVFFQFQQSAAVKRAVQELVAGAELRAAAAEKTALEDINERLQVRADELERINAEFAQEQAEEDVKRQNLEDEIKELQLADNSCRISEPAFNRLRNR